MVVLQLGTWTEYRRWHSPLGYHRRPPALLLLVEEEDTQQEEQRKLKELRKQPDEDEIRRDDQ